MGIIIRQGLKASLGFYIGTVIGAINILFISTEVFTPNQVGIASIIVNSSLVLSSFAHLSSPLICDRFFVHFRNDEQKHRGFLSFILLLPLVGVLLILAFYGLYKQEIAAVFAKKSPTLIPYIYLIIPLTAFSCYNLILEAYCRNNARIAVPTFVREVFLKAANLILAVFYWLGWINFDVFLYALIGSYFLSVLILFGYVVNLGKLYLTWDSTVWTKSLKKEIVIFGSLALFSGVAVTTIASIDRTFVGVTAGTTQVAILGVAIFIASIIEIPSKAIRSISGPIIATAIKENNWTKVEELYQKSALNLLLLGGIVFVLVATNLSNLIEILPKANIYRNGEMAVLIISFAKLIDMAAGLNSEVIGYSAYYKVSTVMIILLAIFTVIANALLIPIFGITGSAIATATTSVLYTTSKAAFVWYKFKIRTLNKTLWSSVAILLTVGLIGFLFPDFGTDKIVRMLSISIKSIIISALFAFFVIRFNISTELNDFYNKYVMKL